MPLHNPAPTPITDMPTGLKGQSFSRLQSTIPRTPTSGGMTGTAVPIAAGTVITGLSILSSTVALAGGSHFWLALYDPSMNLLGQSVNDTAPVIAANARKDVSLASPVIAAASGLYLAMFMAVATTMPSLVAVNPGNASTIVLSTPPVIGGNFNTGLTATAPATASAPGNAATPWFGYF